MTVIQCIAELVQAELSRLCRRFQEAVLLVFHIMWFEYTVLSQSNIHTYTILPYLEPCGPQQTRITDLSEPPSM